MAYERDNRMAGFVEITIQDRAHVAPPEALSDDVRVIDWRYRLGTGEGGYAAVGLVMQGTHPVETVLRQWGGDRPVSEIELGYIDGVAVFRGGVAVAYGAETMYRSGDDGNRVLLEIDRGGAIVNDFASLTGKGYPDYGLDALGWSGDAILFRTGDSLYEITNAGEVKCESLSRATYMFAVTRIDHRILAVVYAKATGFQVVLGSTARDWTVVGTLDSVGVGWRCLRPGLLESDMPDGRVQRVEYVG